MSVFAPLVDAWGSVSWQESAAPDLHGRSLNVVPNERVNIELMLLNNLWWDLRKLFQNLRAMAWEFLPKTVRLTNPRPRVVTAEHAAAWLTRELCLFEVFNVLNKLPMFFQEKGLQFSYTWADVLLLVVVKHFSACEVGGKCPFCAATRSTSVLSRWQNQANSRAPAATWQLAAGRPWFKLPFFSWESTANLTFKVNRAWDSNHLYLWPRNQLLSLEANCSSSQEQVLCSRRSLRFGGRFVLLLCAGRAVNCKSLLSLGR